MENQGDYLALPFTILIDTQEGSPWLFKNIIGDSKDGYKRLIVETRYQCLGRHPRSFGDYTIDGQRGRLCIERKSVADAQSTILGWSSAGTGFVSRRDRFESELSNLAGAVSAIVIVEGTMENCLLSMPSYGVKTADENRKSFWRSVLSYQQDYPRVQWMFCDGVRRAEEYALFWMRRYWKKHVKDQEVVI